MARIRRGGAGGVLIALVAALGLLSAHADARPVSSEDAVKAVGGWLRHPGHGLKARLGNAVKNVEVFRDAAGAPVYFVAYLKPSGFVILPADDLVEPVICFSPEGKYVASDENPLGALVMRDVPHRLALARGKPQDVRANERSDYLRAPQDVRANERSDYLRAPQDVRANERSDYLRAPAAAKPESRQKAAQRKWGQLRIAAAGDEALPGLSIVSDVRVLPLIQSLWDQGDAAGDNCYNYYTPNHYVDGCVATAMAQLMRYHQFPTAGVGTAGFSIYVGGKPQTANVRGGDGNGGPYDWADMPLAPANGLTDAQGQAIGALCYDAGVAVHMEYAQGSSGASAINIVPALTNVFLFSNAICGGNGNDIGIGLIGMINPNLDAGFPVLLSILNTAGNNGHEIVADGYGYDSSTLYHHLNMGWSGRYNAWYNLPVLSAGGDSWQSITFCAYNVFPAGSGEIISGRVTDGSGVAVSGATVTAARAQGGAYTATTNMYGVYALANVPSASSYTLTAAAAGYTFAPQDVSTGRSMSYYSISGNVWGADFVGGAVGSTRTLTVNSSPIQAVAVTGTFPGTTNYSVSGLANGTSVSLTAPATATSNGTPYNFVQWRGPSGWTTSAPTVSGTISANTTLEADYAPQTWTLTVNSTPVRGAGIFGTNAGVTNYSVPGIVNGTGIRLTASATLIWAGATYSFVEWTAPADWTVQGATVSGTLQADSTLQANYAPQTAWTLSVQPPTGSGITSPATGDYAYSVGAGATVQATASAGWSFDHWLGDGVATGHATDNPLSVASGAAGQTQHVTAVFVQQSPVQWTLSVQAPTGSGITSPATGDYAYSVGAGATVQATASAGWSFDHWLGDGVATGHATDNPLSVASGTAGQTQHVAAVFVQSQQQPQWTLTVNSTPNQGIAVAGTYPGTTNYSAAAVPDGAAVNLSVSSSDPSGVVFQDWKVTAGAAAPVTTTQRTVAFTMTADTVAVAEYQTAAYCIVNVQSTPIASIWISSSTGHSGRTNYSKQGLKSGTAISLSVPSGDPVGYNFAQWRLNGVAQPAGQRTVSFVATGATTLVAEFRSGGCIVAVQSAPLVGAIITSSTGHSGTTNYSNTVADGTVMNLTAPGSSSWNGTTYNFVKWTAPAGWTVSGTAVSGTVHADATLVADYSAATTWSLNVGSTPNSGITIAGTYAGTTNYAVQGIADGQAVSLSAPASDPPGYAFVDWKVTVGAAAPVTTTQRSIAFTMTGDASAVAEYQSAGPLLSVQSTPVTGLTITSTTGHPGITNYSLSVAAGTAVSLNAPSGDPAGYTFAQWRLNGAVQVPGQKTLNFTMSAAAAAVAEYQPVMCTVNVQSTPVAGILIASETGHGGATNYSRQGVAYGTTVTLSAPSGDPTGYVFAQWRLNGTAQAAGQKAVSFTVNGPTMTAAAEYTTVAYSLSVQSTPITGVVIASATGSGGVTNYSQNFTTSSAVYLRVPTVDPSGYVFVRWTLNGAAQPPGQRISIFILTGPTAAIAEYRSAQP